MSIRNIWLASTAAVVLALGGYFVWKALQPAPRDPALQVNSMDELQGQLAQRVATKFGGEKDFQVVVTVLQDPIGTLMEPGRSVADDDQSCRPKADPDSRVAPSLFPAYQTNMAVAGSFGLDAPLSELGRAHANTRTSDAVILTIDGPAGQILTGSSLRAVLEDATCRKAMGSRTMWLVRGYISGQRAFTITSDRAVDIKAGTKLASFDIAPTSDNRITLRDEKPTMFLQVVSEVRAPDEPQPALVQQVVKGPPPLAQGILPGPPLAQPAPPVGGATPGTSALNVTAPKAPAAAVAGRIYLQQDTADKNPAEIRKVVTALSAYTVVRKVERVPSAKMPRAPQVRYFNAPDKGRAEQVAQALKAAGLTTTVTRIGLPAPPGQLEVWFARVGS